MAGDVDLGYIKRPHPDIYPAYLLLCGIGGVSAPALQTIRPESGQHIDHVLINGIFY
jgi:hypothetical protein